MTEEVPIRPRSLPTRVSRDGGVVRTFDEPRLAFKKVAVGPQLVMCELLIPPGTRVVYPDKPSGSWSSQKLRVERATVWRILANTTRAVSPCGPQKLPYIEGETVEPTTFDSDTDTVSAAGIHCFGSRKALYDWQPDDHRGHDYTQEVCS